jgi:putative hydrolase of the HAD superfamily
MFSALLIDLDDTLVPQAPFLSTAWAHVATAIAAQCGHEASAIEGRLNFWCSQGSDRGGIIDRTIDDLVLDQRLLAVGVKAFREFRPQMLVPYPGVYEGLRALRSAGIAIAIVTDGNVELQVAKVEASNLTHEVDAIVYSDSLGREFRKPHRAPFERALELLRASPHQAVMIGDRPAKDVAGAAALGLRTIRVRQGEYSGAPDIPRATYCVGSVSQALQILVELSKPYAVA